MNTTSILFASNKLRDIERRFSADLSPLYGPDESRSLFLLLCEAFLGFDTTAFLLHRDEPVNQSDMLRFHWALLDLKEFRPVQHIIGHTSFCGCRIDVNSDVLIPRPETEELVRLLFQRFPLSQPPRRAADLCTGSGCIAIALKNHFPQCHVDAFDVSDKALAIARRNAGSNNSDIHFFQTDLLSDLESATAPYDLVVSNPPYICHHERASMSRNVTDHEPALALFVLFYKAIVRFSLRCLAPGGTVAVETNQLHALATSRLFADNGFNSCLLKDFRGNDRFVIASLSNP